MTDDRGPRIASDSAGGCLSFPSRNGLWRAASGACRTPYRPRREPPTATATIRDEQAGDGLAPQIGRLALSVLAPLRSAGAPLEVRGIEPPSFRVRSFLPQTYRVRKSVTLELCKPVTLVLTNLQSLYALLAFVAKKIQSL